ncbi:NUDIX hydrolase [Streptomyces sp. WAC05374]|uniref:NUDIX domain-containing protein n=2 Tax=Streptomyces sp. WAC05374 TaxID=2487420 RepID=UPI000F8707EF|nr:NUDIX hydrolase [Streptomyces sp. WAC05374]RST18509.1 NUDIX hydrolase [Streptomyces sp. WAC05374]TDF41039.1 NUDIX hydrolase [Streptomyces sp. WAC05374]TDF49802.1 NUDIX hydrolase [Streptomyces sp. WAC05374]TDF51309.1 NUDIX hydrolase [Streptomyces sp. WAC05374]
MTTTSAPDERPSVAMKEEAYGALRASAALWAGTSVLITDKRGQVLLQRVTYRSTRLLPGGAVDKGESPAQGAARELEEELGVTAPVTRGLAVDWVSPAGRRTPAAMKFPGELLHVFDGGVWDEDQIAAIRPAPGEIDGIEFVEPAELPALMSPGDARRALSALRARISGAGAAFLEDGLPITPTVLDRVGVLRTARAHHHLLFHPIPVPNGLTVRQSWVWAFAPDGRVLVLLEPDTGAACLPGGTPEPADRADPENTLLREAREEAAAELAGTRYLGYLSDPGEPCARVRYAAALASLGPASVDPATGRTYTRILATPEQALQFFDWGPSAAEQLQAAHHARSLLGIPKAAHQPVTELADPTAW